MRTTLTLGGGLGNSVRLAARVLRSEGFQGISWRVANARNIALGRQDPWMRFVLEDCRCRGFDVQRLERFWAGQDDAMVAELKALCSSRNRARARAASWTLSRWYARHGNWDAVHDVLAPAFQVGNEDSENWPLGICLLWLDALRLTGRTQEGLTWLQTMQASELGPVSAADLALAHANLVYPVPGQGGDAAWLEVLNRLYMAQGLTPIGLRKISAGLQFDNLQTQTGAPVQGGPLVSVIVPAYNAEATLATVMHALLAQTWQALEVLVVDDCSADDTAKIAAQFMRKDSRVRLIRMPCNLGAYATRNQGASQARGKFITVHDSDDWSHAQKIEKQVQALLAKDGPLISFSQWSRSDDALMFGCWNTPAQWRGYVHRNTSSMMLRREAFERLGYWDQVRCSADSEYYHRALHVFGAKNMVDVMPGLPLSFGRVLPGSLTQQSTTHLFTLFGGLRKDYHEAFSRWHREHFKSTDSKSLFLEKNPSKRPFSTSQQMLHKTSTKSYSE